MAKQTGPSFICSGKHQTWHICSIDPYNQFLKWPKKKNRSPLVAAILNFKMAALIYLFSLISPKLWHIETNLHWLPPYCLGLRIHWKQNMIRSVSLNVNITYVPIMVLSWKSERWFDASAGLLLIGETYFNDEVLCSKISEAHATKLDSELSGLSI